jgi:hypothetical protein
MSSTYLGNRIYIYNIIYIYIYNYSILYYIGDILGISWGYIYIYCFIFPRVDNQWGHIVMIVSYQTVKPSMNDSLVVVCGNM